MKYFCIQGGSEHDGFPSWAADRPADYWDVPVEKRPTDVFLSSDSCVIADRFFFIRACLDIPIIGREESYTWGVWVSLSETNFFIWQDNYDTPARTHLGPFFGWLCSSISVYPETRSMKTYVHLRDNAQRPLIKLEPTEHPLAIHQREGITIDELAGMMHALEAQNGVEGPSM